VKKAQRLQGTWCKRCNRLVPSWTATQIAVINEINPTLIRIGHKWTINRLGDRKKSASGMITSQNRRELNTCLHVNLARFRANRREETGAIEQEKSASILPILLSHKLQRQRRLNCKVLLELRNPGLDALIGQIWLVILIERQAYKFSVSQCFRFTKVIAVYRPVAHCCAT